MNELTHRRWGMTIDVNRCVGCQTCTVACKHANDTVPEVQWRKVLDVEVGQYPDVERLFLVTGCQHCAEPSCVPVCPTGATKQREDGLITMDYDLCIGCASCAVACPYQARTIVHDKPTYFGIATPQETKVAHDERVGVAQKCTFCIDRIDEGLTNGFEPGTDPLATPACASSCISQAIKFGDFNDPKSEVSKLTAERDFFQMHEELGNDPQIKYLIETPAVPSRLSDENDLNDEALSDTENALVGKRQDFWDMRAAMNFILGGIGSGAIIMSYFFSLLGSIETSELMRINLVSGIIIAVGLFFVWLKIGRKFLVFNGVDGEFEAEIIDKLNNEIMCKLNRKIRKQLVEPRLNLIFSLVKKDRVFNIIEKCTELGVSNFQPIISERTQNTNFRL